MRPVCQEAIAINQDPLGKTAVRINGDHSWDSLMNSGRLPLSPAAWANGEQLAKPLANGDWAVLLFNRLNTTIDINMQFVDLGNTSLTCWDVRDIWNRTDLGRFNGGFAAAGVPAHGNRFLRLSNGSVCTPPPPPPPCTKPPAAPSGFKVHPARGWYVANSRQHLVGDKETMTVDKCAKACVASKDRCGAFHVFMSKGCDLGDCYIHMLPLGEFVPGNPGAYAYDREG